MDKTLERAIDNAGRAKVFERARELGWTNEAPPAWVWWGILGQMAQERLENYVIMAAE